MKKILMLLTLMTCVFTAKSQTPFEEMSRNYPADYEKLNQYSDAGKALLDKYLNELNTQRNLDFYSDTSNLAFKVPAQNMLPYKDKVTINLWKGEGTYGYRVEYTTSDRSITWMCHYVHSKNSLLMWVMIDKSQRTDFLSSIGGGLINIGTTGCSEAFNLPNNSYFDVITKDEPRQRWPQKVVDNTYFIERLKQMKVL